MTQTRRGAALVQRPTAAPGINPDRIHAGASASKRVNNPLASPHQTTKVAARSLLPSGSERDTLLAGHRQWHTGLVTALWH